MELPEYLAKIDGVAPKITDESRTVTVEGFTLTIEPGIWNPDRGKSSPMFISTLKEYGLDGITSAMDLGTGSGILALILSKRGIRKVSAADKLQNSVEVANQNFQTNHAEVVAIESDLFSNIEGSFDLVVFNAPATHPTRRKMAEVMPTLWSSEENLIKRFLQEWKDHKTPNGRALIMYSKFPDFNPLDGDTLEGFNWRIIKEQKGEMSESGIIEVWK
jgi:methylase of polypeptide subunit release factors